MQPVVRRWSVSEEALVRWIRRRGIVATHCDSCHAEAEYRDDGDLPNPVMLSRGREAHVCCGVREAFDKANSCIREEEGGGG